MEKEIEDAMGIEEKIKEVEGSDDDIKISHTSMPQWKPETIDVPSDRFPILAEIGKGPLISYTLSKHSWEK